MMSGRESRANKRERLLDDELCFGPWNQHVWTHLEVHPPELTHAEDVGHGLAPFAPRDQRLVFQDENARRIFIRDRRETARLIPTEHPTREHFGVERGEAGADAGAHKSIACTLHQVVDRCMIMMWPWPL